MIYDWVCALFFNLSKFGSWFLCAQKQLQTSKTPCFTPCRNFQHFGPFFRPFSPLITWKIKILTFKKAPGGIIILHICTINDHHMMHGSWDMECNKHNFLSFWMVFCPFTPLWTQKIKIFKKNGKNTWRYYFTNINKSHMMYGSSDMDCNGQNFLSFWAVSCSFTPLTTQKMKILKKWKKHLEILSFCIGVT